GAVQPPAAVLAADVGSTLGVGAPVAAVVLVPGVDAPVVLAVDAVQPHAAALAARFVDAVQPHAAALAVAVRLAPGACAPVVAARVAAVALAPGVGAPAVGVL